MKKSLGILVLLFIFWPNFSFACNCQGGNCQNGVGYQEYPNNHSYLGEFLNCKKHGKGVYDRGDGTIYKGEFKDDYMFGKGLSQYDNGDFYIGGFKNDKRYGKGFYTQANGNIWEIETDENNNNIYQKKIVDRSEKYTEKFLTTVNGVATYVWPNGEMYTGDVLNNNRHGKGTYMYADGEKYEGEYKNNKRHGEGTFIYANIIVGIVKTQDKYTGQWVNNKRHGLGTYYFGDSNKKTYGKWENGKFVGLSGSDQKTFDQLKLKISQASNLAKLCVMVQKNLQNFYLARVSDANKYIKNKNLDGMRKSIRDFREISIMGFTASGNTDQYCKAGIN